MAKTCMIERELKRRETVKKYAAKRAELFAVINERVLQNLPTVCITNLDLRGLHAKYGERLASRLYDVNTTQVLHLTGENLRTVR